MIMPSRSDGILQKALDQVIVSASGSLGFFYDDGKCRETQPNTTLTEGDRLEWCSNAPPKNEGQPWISYSISNKAMKLTGYSVKNGCCYYSCCCVPATGEIIDGHCCCELYSYSLQGSNDNKTWTVIHSVEKDRDFPFCHVKTFEFPQTQSFDFIRFVLDEQRDYCPNCMQINQFELYGETVNSNSLLYGDLEENDESISIIGKVKKY